MVRHGVVVGLGVMLLVTGSAGMASAARVDQNDAFMLWWQGARGGERGLNTTFVDKFPVDAATAAGIGEYAATDQEGNRYARQTDALVGIDPNAREKIIDIDREAGDGRAEYCGIFSNGNGDSYALIPVGTAAELQAFLDRHPEVILKQHCCRPVVVSLCGQTVDLDYGTDTTVAVVGAGYSMRQAFVCRDSAWQGHVMTGYCTDYTVTQTNSGTGGSGGSHSTEQRGYHNDQTGGYVSESDYNQAVQNGQDMSGYSRNEAGNTTNTQGQTDTGTGSDTGDGGGGAGGGGGGGEGGGGGGGGDD